MIQQFARCNNIILLEHYEDGQLVGLEEMDDLALIGFLFHHIQQLGGSMKLNGASIFALSMAQTCGSSASSDDYVGVQRKGTHVIAVKLRTLLQ